MGTNNKMERKDALRTLNSHKKDLCPNLDDVEIYSFFQYTNHTNPPTISNFYTLAVLSKSTNTHSWNYYKEKIINKKRIRIDHNGQQLNYGIKYTKISYLLFLIKYSKYLKTGSFDLGGPIKLKNDDSFYDSFVPSDGTNKVPLNKVLKNNFHNGSYIIEHFDNSKDDFPWIFESPMILNKLTSEFEKYVPISFSELSDRIGNFIIQFPITTLMSNHTKTNSNEIVIKSIIPKNHPSFPI